MIYNHKSIAGFLKSELAGRIAKDKTYSLRTMAKELDLSPAYLSQLINLKKNLGPDRSVKVAELLGLGKQETKYFFLLSQLEQTPDSQRASVEKQLNDLSLDYEEESLEADSFQAISDWFHIPILEMTYLDDFEFTTPNVAKRLGISEVEAGAGIERLHRLGLVQLAPDGTYKKTEENFVFRTNRRNEAFGHFLREIMLVGAESMDHQPVNERIVMSQTFCIDQSQMEEARQISREYIQRMAGLFKTAKTHNQTYQLCVQFFNLTDGKPKSGSLAQRDDEIEA
jgi:uncharacterized protein (TIGR02147 family)